MPGPLSVDAFRRHVRDFLATDVLPHVDEWERANTLPRTAFEAFARAGLTGHIIPAEYGGLGLTMRHAVALVEEMMEHSLGGVATSLLAQSHSVLPLLQELGTDEQRSRFLLPSVRGELISGIAITEPTGGSDLINAVQTVAEDRGDHWALTGEKLFITNGPVADFLVVLARTAPDRGSLGMTLFVVDTATAGFTVREKLDKVGARSSPTGWLEFSDCRIPKNSVLGELHRGFPEATNKLVNERVLVAASGLANARACLRDTARLTRADPWSRRQELAHLLAEVEAGFAFVYRTIEGLPGGRAQQQDVAAAKFLMVELTQRVIKRCVELLGVRAFRSDAVISRSFRDARIMGIFAGSSETMREVFAAALIQGIGLRAGQEWPVARGDR